jgi:hypothetical protein
MSAGLARADVNPGGADQRERGERAQQRTSAHRFEVGCEGTGGKVAGRHGGLEVRGGQQRHAGRDLISATARILATRITVCTASRRARHP